MTSEAWWALAAVVSWTAAATVTVHMLRSMRDTPPPSRQCQWVACERDATGRVRVRHPAGDVAIWVCTPHLRLACRPPRDEQVFDQEFDELENHANNGEQK